MREKEKSISVRRESPPPQSKCGFKTRRNTGTVPVRSNLKVNTRNVPIIVVRFEAFCVIRPR
jgi:hypothetical protein